MNDMTMMRTAVASAPTAWPRYLIGVLLWVGVVWSTSASAGDADLWMVGFTVLLASLPSAFTLAYLSGVRRIDFLNKVSRGSWIRPVLSGYIIRLAVGLALAMLTGLGLVLALFAGPDRPLLWSLAAAPLFLVILVHFVDRRVGGDAVPWYRHTLALTPAILGATALSAALYVVITFYEPAPVRYASLLEAVEAQREYDGSSQLVTAVTSISSFLSGAQAWAMGIIRSEAGRPLLAAMGMGAAGAVSLTRTRLRGTSHPLPHADLRP